MGGGWKVKYASPNMGSVTIRDPGQRPRKGI